MKASKTNKKVMRTTCPECMGYGLVKRSIIICRKCKGKKCMFCRESGFHVQPYEKCGTCYGDGEIEVNKAE